ncbi:MAG TPA: hypothetical protein VMZ24_06060 [Patescibacteria group bacterium]|nr:hypothetical protein [Patescibacteria group bacterium]
MTINYNRFQTQHKMKTPAFYSPSIAPPESYKNEEFILRPLLTSHVELDYAALMVSKEMLRQWGGSEWPAAHFDLKGNLADLAEHQREHETGVAFTYTMLNLAEDECLGCVYIEPLLRYLELGRVTSPAYATTVADFEAVVRFWVKEPRLDDNLDQRLFQALISWIKKEWLFYRVFCRVNSRDRRQVTLVEEAELQLQYTLEIPGRIGQYLLYGFIRPDSRAGDSGKE